MKSYYEALLNSITEGASIIDRDGYIRFTNDAYAKKIREEKQFMTTSNMYSEIYDKKLSFNVFRAVMKEKREIRKTQIYLNEQGLAFRVMVYEKPVLVDGSIEQVLAFAENVVYLGQADNLEQFSDIHSTFICESPAMRRLVKQAKFIASRPVNVLLSGETGVGKDKIAELIYQNSERRNRPFVAINCAAIAENLIESELFGYEDGAFTGAAKKGKKGLIEQADGGTLFLDEINSLPLGLQGKLLRALETKTIRRVGAVTERKVDFRLISASNTDLAAYVQEGHFREDLFFRINVITIPIPPLRERKEDIPRLLEYFVGQFNQQYNVDVHLTNQIYRDALMYSWPGNVRELRNFAERLVVSGISSFGSLQASTFQAGRTEHDGLPVSVSSGTLKQRIAHFEKEIIKEALKSNKTKLSAAKALGIDPAVLSRKILKYGLRN